MNKEKKLFKKLFYFKFLMIQLHFIKKNLILDRKHKDLLSILYHQNLLINAIINCQFM